MRFGDFKGITFIFKFHENWTLGSKLKGNMDTHKT